MTELCLGTAALGMEYGITNNKGQVSRSEANKILGSADTNGISWLDTAPAYGTAESIIGNLKATKRFQIITKISCGSQDSFAEKDELRWNKELEKSLRRLGRDSISCLMIHSPEDLKKPGSEILKRWLSEVKARGLSERVGISVYNENDLMLVDRESFDVVQLPLSLYNQNLLLNGQIKALIDKGYAIHARSIFLQGLLASEIENWPGWANKEAYETHKRLKKLAQSMGKTLLGLSIDFIKSQDYLELVLVGVTSEKELKEIISAWQDDIQPLKDWSEWASTDKMLIDPREWPT